MILVGIISIFKSYPSLGDFTLWHTLLLFFPTLHPRSSQLPSSSTNPGADLANPLLLISTTLYSLFLLPTFHHLWLYSGSGNANFFYASTLVWSIAQGGILIDFVGAEGRERVLRGLDRKVKGARQRVEEGRLKVFQK